MKAVQHQVVGDVRTMSDQSLYERLGGEAGVDTAVDIFYRKVLADDRISHFFEVIDMEQQAIAQKAFLTVAFGGPNQYTGADMRRSHQHLALDDSHFDAVIEILTTTLRELATAEHLIDEVRELLQATRADVLNR